MNRFFAPLAASIALIFVASAAMAGEQPSEALKAQAKISEADAQSTALAKVPGGAIESSELEKEHGKLIWSFDISRSDSSDITEVNVDAKTGKIVAIHKEMPAQQAKEAKADKAEKAKKAKDQAATKKQGSGP